MMKKTVCILLSVLFLLPVLATLGIGSAAQSTYEELWAEKIAYEKDHPVTDGVNEASMWDLFYDFDWNFVLYTEKGKDLTFEISNEYWEETDEYVLAEVGDNEYLLCKEMREIALSCFVYDENGNSCGPGPVYSGVRKLVQTLGISRKEVLEAYDKMKNEPECIRSVLSFLSDEQFRYYVSHVKSIEKPLNFMLEAPFFEDDAQGESLLCKTGTVYFPELGYSLATTRLVGEDRSTAFPIEMFARFDLTSDEFGYYLNNLRYYLTEQAPGKYDWMIVSEGDTALDRLVYLEGVREAQLAAAETGDNAVTALWVVALALPALAVVTLKRKRKI